MIGVKMGAIILPGLESVEPGGLYPDTFQASFHGLRENSYQIYVGSIPNQRLHSHAEHGNELAALVPTVSVGIHIGFTSEASLITVCIPTRSMGTRKRGHFV